MALSRTYECGRLHQPHNGIYFLQGSLRNLYHVFSKLVFCLVDTWCVQKYDLSAFHIRIDSLDTVSGGLRFIGCDCDLLSDKMVHQRGFSNIRSSDDRNKA